MAEIEKVDTETTEKDSEGAEESQETENTESEESEEAEKPKETFEARKARLERQLERVNKKLGINTEEKPKPKVENKKSEDLDDGQLAYLATRGIVSDEDIDFTKGQLKERGGNLRELLGKKWFQSELKERQDAKTVLDATPTGSRRGNVRPADAVEYEYAKYLKTGKLPADREMRTKLVDMRYKKTQRDSEFSD